MVLLAMASNVSFSPLDLFGGERGLSGSLWSFGQVLPGIAAGFFSSPRGCLWCFTYHCNLPGFAFFLFNRYFWPC